MVATGIMPTDAAEALDRRPATIQDKWFARLYLIKALVIASLVAFWSVSGVIALFVAYDAAAEILRAHAFPQALVAPITVLTSLMDIGIGVLIAARRAGQDRAGVGSDAGRACDTGQQVAFSSQVGAGSRQENASEKCKDESQ